MVDGGWWMVADDSLDAGASKRHITGCRYLAAPSMYIQRSIIVA